MRYGEMRVVSSMVPVKHMTSVEISDDFESISRVFEQSGYSRVPVTCGGLQRVVGVLYRVDFYRLRLAGGVDIRGILRPVFRCKPTDRISDLLKTMQSTRCHIAIVADGARVVGLITVDDILAELVGRIY